MRMTEGSIEQILSMSARKGDERLAEAAWEMLNVNLAGAHSASDTARTCGLHGGQHRADPEHLQSIYREAISAWQRLAEVCSMSTLQWLLTPALGQRMRGCVSSLLFHTCA